MLPTPESDHRAGLHNGSPNASCGLCRRRIVLVHLNVQPPAGDHRNADEIADSLMAALEVGSDDDSVRTLNVCLTFAEEI